MPWKNGRGETIEIAIWPPGATVADFDWRISMATVATDGPFSLFPGLDRTLLVLDGGGMILTVGGGPPVLLTPMAAPFAFAGDVATSATLVGGPIVDLNVMTRRDAFRHRVDMVTLGAARLDQITGCRVVFCRQGVVSVKRGRMRLEAGKGDTILSDEGALEVEAYGQDAAEIVVVQLGPIPDAEA